MNWTRERNGRSSASSLTIKRARPSDMVFCVSCVSADTLAGLEAELLTNVKILLSVFVQTLGIEDATFLLVVVIRPTCRGVWWYAKHTESNEASSLKLERFEQKPDSWQ